MEIVQTLLDYAGTVSLWGNSGDSYVFAILIFSFALALFRVFHHTVLWRLEALSVKTDIQVDDVLIKILKRVKWWFYIIFSLYIAAFYLSFSETVWQVLNGIFIVTLVYQIAQSIGIVVEYFVDFKMADTGDEGQAQAIAGVLTKIVKGVIWVIALLFILSNVGIDITSLITGLGIGGIAIALALQTILGDLFSSFAIYFDKPFQVGDFIIVGDMMGTVESIGIKTTRLRSLHGEEIVMSNRELTTAQIRNFRGTDEFRAEFDVGVSYDTDAEGLERAKEIIEKIVSSINDVRFERSNVTAFADSSITITTSFYTKTGDYSLHVRKKHNILRNIKREFDKEGIAIAYPTRTVHLINN